MKWDANRKKKTSYLVSGNLPEFSCGCFHAGFPDDFRRIRSRHVLFHGDTQPSLLQVWRILITWNKPFRQRQVTWLPSPCCYFYWRFPDLFRHCLNLTSHGPSAGRLFTFRTEWIGYLCFHFTSAGWCLEEFRVAEHVCLIVFLYLYVIPIHYRMLRPVGAVTSAAGRFILMTVCSRLL